MGKRNKNKFRSRQAQAASPSAPQEGAVAPAASRAGQTQVQNISQQRAAHALRMVQGWLNQPGIKQKEIKSYVNSFAPMILMSGFGQTCAFYKSKGDEHARALDDMASWLLPQVNGLNGNNLITAITQWDARTYQLAEAEALAYLDWMKKFARAYLEDDDAGQAGGGHAASA